MGEFFKNDGRDIAVVKKVEIEMEIVFPSSYVEFSRQQYLRRG